MLLLLSAGSTLHAQTRRIAVLPFRPIGIDSTLAETVSNLVRSELGHNAAFSVIESGRTPSTVCQDIDCAVAAGTTAGADLVVYGSVSKLGAKYIASYSVGEVATAKKTRSGERFAFGAESLDAAAQEVAAEIGGRSGESLPSTVAATRVVNRRYDTVAIGVGFGQLYPTRGFNGVDRALAFDVRMSLEKSDISIDLLTAWRMGLLLNLGASYMMVDGPLCPYVGAGLGYQLSEADQVDNGYYSEPIYDGSFQAMARGGVWFFRGGMIRAFINADYLYSFEGTQPRAVTVTLGVAGVTDQLRLF